ncbi:hypothetical protein I315_02909 [Cryptococcus gattii Ru294]|nr:hypothetical protein I315_02909 [Cryptococcus gattii Ru294]
MSGVYRYTQRLAHEKPVIFWSLLLGLAVPNRPRQPVNGYEDN